MDLFCIRTDTLDYSIMGCQVLHRHENPPSVYFFSLIFAKKKKEESGAGTHMLSTPVCYCKYTNARIPSAEASEALIQR
ncbi:hypothetical protein NHJ13051_006935 [Beauveria bassiana]